MPNILLDAIYENNVTEATRLLNSENAIHLINTPDEDGVLPIHFVCDLLYDNVEILKAIIELGFDPNVADSAGETALHHAIRSKNFDQIMYLLSLLNLKMSSTLTLDDMPSRTPLDYAHDYFPEIVDILETYLFDICVVDIASQTMQVQFKYAPPKTYPISTSKFGIGNISGSYKTPLGIHKICDKVGAFAPLYTIFKATQNPDSTGEICNNLNVKMEHDLVLTRVLRLQGLQPGINSGVSATGECVDSFSREIWIHGTNREDLIDKKTPSSIGCIRMKNADIAELFTHIKIGTNVIIKNKCLF